MNVVQCYGLTYKNPDKMRRLKERFQKENLDIEILESVDHTDSRVACAPHGGYKLWSCMWGHMNMIKRFLESNALYGIFCEDDILLRKGFDKRIPEFIFAYERMNLDILLLGYLLPYVPVLIQQCHLTLIEEPLNYLNYGNDVWGAQMYMLNRKTAEKFLNKYTQDYALSTINNDSIASFNPDWTITKDGRRALVYPMFALEEGNVDTDHHAQYSFHKHCHNLHYIEGLYH